MTIVQEIPLAKLVPSSANVRKANPTDGIFELAASIKAHGLLQNLTVRKGTGKTKGKFEVIAGGRRLAALQRLAGKKEIAANAPIRCRVVEAEDAGEISLAENVLQCPMHPADQYEAFAKLHSEQGLSAKDIGARFGVSAVVVRQRLKLGAVSPQLIALYRQDEMNLDQLTAFTVTEDHAAQERVWSELGRNNGRSAILRALTEGQVSTCDRRFAYVGTEAYEKAGGTIIRDLFDSEGGGYGTDAVLLNRLVREKLQRAAKKVMAEGWKWVVVEPDFDHESTAVMRRIYPALGPEDEARQKALKTEFEALWEDAENKDEPSDRMEALEREIAAFAEREEYRAEDLAMAGAFVSLGHDGKSCVGRGYVRPEDGAPEAEDDDDRTDSQPATAKPPVSEKLAAELTAHYTAALRNEVARDPALALRALTHRLALATFYRGSGPSCLAISATSFPLEHFVPGIVETEAGRQIAARHEAWAKRLPREREALWDYLASLSEPELMALLAHCTALSIDAVREPKHADEQVRAFADRLACAVGLDMTRYWQPTAASYFMRVSKDQILAAVGEAAGEDAAQRLAGLAKSAMAEAAGKLLADKAWLPAILRTA